MKNCPYFNHLQPFYRERCSWAGALLYLLLCLPWMSLAQKPAKKTLPEPAPLQIGEAVTFRSAVLNEDRKLNVYLPQGYHKDSAKTYPVLYLLDGSMNEDFLHIVGLLQFMNMTYAMPETIVVGIANVDRKRDYTFPTSDTAWQRQLPQAGHSARFIECIEKELIPFVNSRYKTGKERMLIGQSLGGLLASEILLQHPGLFNTYIIVSPSLWWDKESLLQLPIKNTDEQVQVFIAVGKEGAVMEQDAATLYRKLEEQQIINRKLAFLPLPEENHATILHQAVFNVLRSLYPYH